MVQTKYISALTPIRGIAALLVLLLHYNTFIAKLTPEGFTHLFDKLYLMVDLFFVLSGFIMYHVYGNIFRNGISKSDFFTFMKARFARIYPLHFFTFLFVLILPLLLTLTGTLSTPFFQVIFDFTALPSQLLLTQAMGTHHEATWNTPSWSISVEWWAYVVFPFIVMWLFKTKAWSRILIGLLILGGYLLITYYAQPLFWAKRWEMMHVPPHIPYPINMIDVITGPFAFLRCLCGFLLGMIVYEAYQKSWGEKWVKSSFVFVGVWLVILNVWHFDIALDFFSLAGFALIILSASYNDGKIKDIFNRKNFQYLGDISYSLYLVHMPLLFLFITLRKIFIPNDPRQLMIGYNFSLGESWVGFILFLTISLFVASLSYNYIEKPARIYLNRAKHPVSMV